jgi:DNA-binding MarR family transcriptional regulator
MAFHNRLRLQQATALRTRIKKDGLGLKEYQVLRVLAVRMAREPKPDSKIKRNRLTITDTCFPKLATICEESILSDSSVRRALDNLIDFDYITKSKIPGRNLRKGNNPNKYENNRYHLVPELWDAAFTPKDKVNAAAGDESTSTPPSISDADRASDEAFVDAIDTKPAQKESKPTLVDDKYAQTETIITLLKIHFGGHATFQRPDAIAIMTDCVRTCIDVAGCGDMCLGVLTRVCGREKTRASIGKSTKLGGYIEVAFKNWLTEYKAAYDKEMWVFVDALCNSDSVSYRISFSRPTINDIKPSCNWLREHLGSHLLELVEDDGTAAGTEEDAQVMMFRVSAEYRAARRLGHDPDQASEDIDTTSDDTEEENRRILDEESAAYDRHLAAQQIDAENRRDREAQY